MGTFLAVSGAIGASREQVVQGLRSFAKGNNGTFEIRHGAVGTPGIGLVLEKEGNTSVLYPDGFCEWDEASSHLSLELGVPVFSFHIHDGDLWMMIAFEKGAEVAWFNPRPDYWDEVSPDERRKWAGDAEAVCRLVPGVRPESIRKYFVTWTEGLENTQSTAYDDDEYSFGSDWQMVDFMRRIGLTYPDAGVGASNDHTFMLKLPPSWRKKAVSTDVSAPPTDSPTPKSKPSTRPWWKFW